MNIFSVSNFFFRSRHIIMLQIDIEIICEKQVELINVEVFGAQKERRKEYTEKLAYSNYPFSFFLF